MTLRLRLLLVVAGAVLSGLVVVGVVTYVVVTSAQLRQVDDAIQRAHTPIEVVARESDPQSWDLISQLAPGFYVAIVGADGTAVYESPGRAAGDDPVDVDASTIELRDGFQTLVATNGDRARVRVDELAPSTTLVIGQSLHEIDETRSRLVLALLAASAVAIVAAVGAGWWLVGAGLAPLRRVESSAAAISESDLGDLRVPGADRTTEVGNLARALNDMLDRLRDARDDREQTMAELQASEARMRRFVADASHELRTPLAATAAYAELFDHGARDRPEDLERTIAGIRLETARMTDLVDDLLLLARLDEQRPLERTDVDLTEVVLNSVHAARTIEPDRPISIGMDDVVHVAGDPARLRQVVDNLLANVRAHTGTATPCSVVLEADDERARLIVADTGPGVSDAALGRLSDRFYRADEARARNTGGSGLGLSIASAIVAAHGGTIDVASAEPHGLIITVTLPCGDRSPVR